MPASKPVLRSASVPDRDEAVILLRELTAEYPDLLPAGYRVQASEPDVLVLVKMPAERQRQLEYGVDASFVRLGPVVHAADWPAYQELIVDA